MEAKVEFDGLENGKHRKEEIVIVAFQTNR